MEDFEDIGQGESQAETVEEPVDDYAHEEEVNQKIDQIVDGVVEVDRKVGDVSEDVDQLLATRDGSSSSDLDYTASLAEIHSDLEDIKQIEAFNGLVSVIICAVVFLVVGIELGKSVVKWLRFGVG